MEIKEGSFLIKEYKSGELVIEIRDELADICFCKIRVTPTQLFRSFVNKEKYVEAKVSVNDLDKVGKTMEIKEMRFLLPPCSWVKQKAVAIKQAKKVCPKGWVPDLDFNKEGSLTGVQKGQGVYGKTKIRRWV